MAQPTNETMSKVNGATSNFINKMGTPGLEKIAHSAGERISDMSADFAQSAADRLESSREYVKAHPLKGVAIAATAGLAVGSLLTLLMKRRKD
jgi:ElaB/YqjD/DUF883 family membrane-anchored ribosome-binding protein